MSIKVFITIDTEEDTWSDYSSVCNPVDNISRLPVLQNILDRYGAMPTYLVNWPVVTNEQSRRILLEIFNRGRCEIGTHCHPWNTPPFDEKISAHNSMFSNLPSESISRKIETLHEKIIEEFKIEPVSFRSGRWDFSTNIARSVYKLGYQIDTSVTPYFDWSYEGGTDYGNALTSIYRFDPEDIFIERKNGCLLEVPVTAGFLQKNFKRSNSLRQQILNGPFSRFHLLGILERLKLLNLCQLSPESISGPEMIRLSKNSIREGHHFLNFSFHTTSLLPGKSPFVRDQQELETFLNNIEMFLKFAADEGMSFVPLSAALDDRDLFASS